MIYLIYEDSSRTVYSCRSSFHSFVVSITLELYFFYYKQNKNLESSPSLSTAIHSLFNKGVALPWLYASFNLLLNTAKARNSLGN